MRTYEKERIGKEKINESERERVRTRKNEEKTE